MTRHEERELAFILLFEKLFSEDTIREILKSAGEARDVEENEFALAMAEGAEAHLGELDALISAYSRKWNKDRISRSVFPSTKRWSWPRNTAGMRMRPLSMGFWAASPGGRRTRYERLPRSGYQQLYHLRRRAW